MFSGELFLDHGQPGTRDRARPGRTAAGEALGDLSLQVSASYFQGLAHCSRGEYCRAIDFFTRIGGALTGERVRERWLVFCRRERGEFCEAVETAREAMEIAEAANHPYTLTVCMLGSG